ncbi:hypothetical protein [Streptomyces sp. NPDC092903]|uniref:hypothetical protein n=1 Tax=Streptomyces sp. NPDC092903 TaxID=3366017 RepID=UPI00380CAC25
MGHLADGSDAARLLGGCTVAGHVRRMQAAAGVRTTRALVYRCLDEHLIDRPARTGRPPADRLTELVWAGMRADIPDTRLVSALATSLRVTSHRVRKVIRSLADEHRTSWCGLLRPAFAANVLTGDEGPEPSSPFDVAATEPGTGKWNPNRQQRFSLSLRASGLSVAECAQWMDVSEVAVSDNWRVCRRLAGVEADRSLVHAALAAGVLEPPVQSVIPKGVPASAVAVWPWLALDVPDGRLPATVSRLSGLPPAEVVAGLASLRGTGMTDCRLIVAGWACGLLDTRSQISAWTRPTTISAPPPRPTPSGSSRTRKDPLSLIPPGMEEGEEPFLPPAGFTATEGVTVAGRTYDFLRVTPDVCRMLLQRVPRPSWGPVLALPGAHAALLVTAPRPLHHDRRSHMGRLLAPGGRVHLPPVDTAAPDCSYWAVPQHRPLWGSADLTWLLSPVSLSAAAPPAARLLGAADV